MKIFTRILLVTLAAALMAMNIDTFVHSAGLLPGGFTGIVLLLQEVLQKFLGVTIPFSVFYWLLNLVPALLCMKVIGRHTTLLSIWMIIISGLFTDILPGLVLTDDILLSAVFGGIINGVSICLSLYAGATSGGTDFISIYVSEKTGRSIWNYVFAGNVVVLCVFGVLFGWTRALYSIFFQFASTQILNMLYKRYQKSTLLIISDKKDEIVTLIKETTFHDATVFTGEGGYTGDQKEMIYSVVSREQIEPLFRAIKKEDPHAFINVLDTRALKGNFFMKKRD